MRVRHPKSLIASALLLIVPIELLLRGFPTHPNTLYLLAMALGPICAILCIRHALYGTKPLMGQGEVHTSLWLSGVSALIGAGLAYASWIRRSQRPSLTLIALLYSAGAVFFVLGAHRERQAEEATLNGGATRP